MAEAVANLPDPQVGYYLLRWSCHASRMQYLARSTPAEYGKQSFAEFDEAVCSALGSLCCIVPTQTQKDVMSFPVKSGGLGLRRSGDVADAAYLGSRSLTHDLCKALRTNHVWGADVDNSYLHAASTRCNDLLEGARMHSRVDGAMPDLNQKVVTKLVDEARLRAWKETASPDDRCRLNSYAGPLAGRVLGAVPSKTLDKHISRQEFSIEISRRLGVDVLDAGMICQFCGIAADAKGSHCLSCVAGGDEIACHNSVRDLVFDYCQRGRLNPEREASGLFRNDSLPDGHRRPADVLCCSSSFLPSRLPDGSRQSNRKVALDLAVINAVGRDHWQATFNGEDAAAAYGEKKRQYRNTAARCLDVGVYFQPVVLTKQGCMAAEAGAVIHGIAESVASCEGLVASQVREELLDRIAVIISRSAAQAIIRRRRRQGHQEETACGRALAAMTALVLPDED